MKFITNKLEFFFGMCLGALIMTAFAIAFMILFDPVVKMKDRHMSDLKHEIGLLRRDIRLANEKVEMYDKVERERSIERSIP